MINGPETEFNTSCGPRLSAVSERFGPDGEKTRETTQLK